MTLLGTVPLTVTRQAAGSYVDGEWVDGGGGPSTFTVVGSVQPISPELLDMLPEGARVSARFVVYVEASEPDVYTVDVGGQVRPDRIEYQGRDYMVQSVGDWTSHVTGIPYREYTMLAVGEDEM